MISAFDILVVAVLAVCVLVAFTRGMTAMLLSLLAWGGAAVATLLLWGWASRLLAPLLGDPKLADFLAGPGVFVVSLVALKILAHMTAKSVREGPVGFLDRSLGALFGLVFGIVAVSLAFLLLDGFLWHGSLPRTVREARTRPLVAYGAAMLAEMGPDFLKKATREPPQLQLPKAEDVRDGARRLLDATGYRAEDAKALDELVEQLDEEKSSDQKQGGKDDSPSSGH
ncbi:MAG: CvpA family protein [Alphaproteobacteria bacterium]|nr:MAG: CvpA family protein [Alphaproteobacteria bacterium]